MEGTEIGQYRLVRKIGEGTMGTVFQAIHLRLNRHVALKVLKGEHLTDDWVAGRFVDEASITSGLRHPNIVEVLDAGTHQGTPFLVMELLEGESLSSRLAKGPLSVAAVLEFAYQASQAVEYAHRRGVIHRDLKPDNLYIVADPRIPGHSLIKVLDFSIAKLRESGAERLMDENSEGPPSAGATRLSAAAPSTLGPVSPGRTATRVGSVFGTPPYMSPEQCRGSRAVDARTDVYALGIILYEMLTGRVPFDGEDLARVLERHASERPLDVRVFAPEVPAEVAAIVDRALAKAPGERYQSMAEFGAALSALSFVPDLERSSVPTDNVKWGRLTPTTLTGIGAPPTGLAAGTLASAKTAPSRLWPRLIAAAVVASLCVAAFAYFSLDLRFNAPAVEAPRGEVMELGVARNEPPKEASPVGTITRASPLESVSLRLATAPQAPAAPAETQASVGLEPAEPANVKPRSPRPPKVALAKGSTALPGSSGVSPSQSQDATGESPLPGTLPSKPVDQPGSLGSGKLTFDSAPWSNVYLNGKLLGSTPLIGVVLPAGTHTLVLRSPETNRKTTYVVEIKANQNLSRFVGWESE